eukprot:TRINITY_DN7403_c0_g1_i1.p1 TRINITY_DN7403_c0_g1~~TRINITY_DN7403_c0_g1_i1.p1  ORF type:complete len:521 (+),score=40.98 TRINITY_DN7403_c0_g1_i1:8-1570(+)
MEQEELLFLANLYDLYPAAINLDEPKPFVVKMKVSETEVVAFKFQGDAVGINFEELLNLINVFFSVDSLDILCGSTVLLYNIPVYRVSMPLELDIGFGIAEDDPCYVLTIDYKFGAFVIITVLGYVVFMDHDGNFQQTHPRLLKNKNSVDLKNLKTPEEHQPYKDALTCSICFSVYEDPVLIDCGHSFCRGCIEQWTDQHSTCPLCRDNCTTLFPSFALKELVSKLVVKCPVKNCTWTGPTIKASEHIKECKLVQCAERGCTWRGKENNFLKHKCKGSSVTCRCGAKHSTIHARVCTSSTLWKDIFSPGTCTDPSCTWKGFSYQEYQHQLECRNARCPVSSCRWTGKRKNLDSHILRCSHLLACANTGCKERFIDKKSLQKHLNQTCVQRIVTCGNCEMWSGKYSEIREHIPFCGLKKCENVGCNWTDYPELYPAHKETCKFQILNCSSCQWEGLRMDCVYSDHDKVPCKNKGMGCRYSNCRRRTLDHIRNCPYNSTECYYCGKRIQYRKIRSHVHQEHH